MSSLTLPDGRTLAYADCGAPDGTPVIFHHGTPGSRLFAALLDDSVSEAGVRVVVPDRPGYGRSDPVDPAEASLADVRADVEALADHLGFDSFGIAGFSGGGPFALACGDLNRVDRVALVSALVPGADTGVFGALATRASPVLGPFFRASDALAGVAPDIVAGQYTDRDVSDEVRKAVARDFREGFHRGPSAAIRENRLFAKATPFGPDATIGAWHGTDDANAPLAAVKRLVEHAPNATLERVGGDHLGAFLDTRGDALSWLTG
jgi:pimeloyl-ACP methyl ester carboxylesterase